MRLPHPLRFSEGGNLCGLHRAGFLSVCVTLGAPRTESKISLRELDFLFRTKAHEKTTTTFESREEHEQLKTRPGEHEEQRRKSLRRNRKFGFWANSGTVKLATIHSFKGWGAHTLFLIIESQPVQNHVADEEFVSDELIYTAITRCRQNLTIINLGNEKYRQFCLKYMPEESVTAP